jgi:hypothetical protein
MNTDGDDRFDSALRDVHARALGQLSPRTRAQLQQRRRAALRGEPRTPATPVRWRYAMPLAAAAALGVLAVGVHVWLASDGDMLAME